MPGGKANIHGGLISRPQLGQFDLFPNVMAKSRRGLAPPSQEAVAIAREELREPLEIYIGKHRGADLVTATTRRQTKGRVQSCARRLARLPDDLELRRQLRKCIGELDINARSELIRCLNEHDRETGHRRSYLWLRASLDSRLPMGPRRTSVLIAVAEFGATNVRSSWRDPFLPDLVKAAAATWKELTGKSALHQDIDKRYPFGDWLGRIVDSASGGRLEVRDGTVVDVLRALKNRPVPGSPRP